MRQKIVYFIRQIGAPDSLAAKWLIFIALVVVVALMFPQGLSVESDYSVGIIWTEADLYAPFAFPIYKNEREYERERELAAAKVYKVFEENAYIAQNSIDSLRKFFDLIEKIIDRKKENEQEIESALSNFPLPLRESEWQTLWLLRNAERQHRNVQHYTFEKLRRDVLLVVNGLYLQGIIDVRKSQFKENELIARRKKTLEQIIPISKLYDVTELGKTVQQTFITGYKAENDTVSVATKIALSFLSPNVVYQKEQTDREVQFATDLVPRTLGAVSEGERIIAKKERITPEIQLRLDSLKKAKEERGAGINAYVTFLGKGLHVFAVVWILAMYLFLFRKRIYHDNRKLILIGTLLLVVSFIAYLTVFIAVPLPLRFLIVVPAMSMLIGIIFDSRVAFYSTVVISLLIAGIRSNDYGIALASLVAGSFAIYTVRDIKKRTQIFRSIIYIFLGYSTAILALGLERYESIETIGNQLLVASFNAILSPIITYGILIFIEKTFSISTELTLVDLSDLNHPLLKELAHKAPGTFHHSVSVATLSASAAEVIGANATLTYVGALYHDIGKMVNSDSFVENQIGSENKHRAMSPRKSARIIASHVDDGIKLAREYHLPESVIDFIPMHHGTMHIGFFYEKAMRQKKNAGEIDENDYRYPGPKPTTKETGIVLLADGIEASTRAIVEPTVEKIEANIESLIKFRLLEGELDESTLNLRDLTRIKESFLKILIGIHHSRLRYPEKESVEQVMPQQPEIVQPKSKREKPGKHASEQRLQRTIDSIDLK
ncbi:MAG: HDIG domain-containing protein [Ignavibacteriales bacterium]|nr:HDIG domain-containing protein [Ignavibacteriales bacterium]